MRPGQVGQTLLGLLQALAASSLLIAFGAASLRPCASSRSVDAGARLLAGRLQGLAFRAVVEARETALVFPEAGANEPFFEVHDEDGDGVTRADHRTGRDGAGPARTLAQDVQGVRIGPPPWPGVSAPPPSTERLGPSTPAVRFGPSRMAVFDAEGHATPGSVFVTDGASALCAVVVAGPTARVRAWCYDRKADAWRRR